MARIEKRVTKKKRTMLRRMLVTGAIVFTLVVVMTISVLVLPNIIFGLRSDKELSNGIEHVSAGDFEKARTSFDLASALDEDNVHAYYNSALVKMTIDGDYKAAIGDLKKAIEVDNKFARAYHNLGIIQYFYSHDRKLAMRNLNKAVELDPQYAPSHIALAMVYESQGEYGKSREEYKKYIELDAEGPFNDWAKQHLKVIEDQPDVDDLGEKLSALIKREEVFYEILCTGDINLSRSDEKSFSSYSPLSIAAPKLVASTVTIGNLISPMTYRKKTSVEDATKCDPKDSFILTEAGYDVIVLANDHIMDYDKGGLEDTIRHLGDSEIKTTGAGNDYAESLQPAVIEIDDFVIKVLSFNDIGPDQALAKTDKPGSLPFSVEIASNAIAAAKIDSSLVIVYLYWGLEKAPYPTKEQKNIARSLIDRGADVVIGTHPDVTQPIELYNDGLIAYSLGKFLYGDAFGTRYYSNKLAVEVSSKGEVLGFRLIPLYIEGTRGGLRETGERIELIDYTLIDKKGNPVNLSSSK